MIYFALRYSLITCLIFFVNSISAQPNEKQIQKNRIRYNSAVKGIHIYPGLWRPVFKTEQIAWISPPWINQGFIWDNFPKATDFIWLDFPKAIFSERGLLFLSHINPDLPSAYNYPEIIQSPWTQNEEGGILYNQKLPNGLEFGGSIAKNDTISIDLELWIKNGSDSIIKEIQMLTCAYLAPIEEFNEKSNENKFIHVPEVGWITLEKALLLRNNSSVYRVGWGKGSLSVADLPVIITISKNKRHIVAYTWWQNTGALWGNALHPSFNADPLIPDLMPGQEVRIKGNIIFFEGSIDEFELYFDKILKQNSNTI